MIEIMPKNLQIGLHKNKRFFENKQSLQTKNIKREMATKVSNRYPEIVSDLNCRGFILSVVFDPRLASKCYSEKWTFLGVP